MSIRRSVATGAIAAVVALSFALPVAAQGQGGGAAAQGRGGQPAQGAGGGGGGARGGGGRGGGGAFGGGPPPFTPAADAKDMKSVLYQWVWHMGMLRGQGEAELVGTAKYDAEGTIQVDGQACTLTKYHVDINYQVPGARTEIECKRANGSTYKNVETVAGRYVWDEDRPGAELVPGEGKATPKPAALEERQIRLWANPHAATKAAIAAAAGVTVDEEFVQNPATLLDKQAAAGVKGTATLAWEGKNAIITYPTPGISGATTTVTLGEKFLPERVVVKHGSNTTEFAYSDYGDYNNPLARIEALWPGRIVESRNGKVVRDTKTTLTQIYQLYTPIAVPASVKKAGPVK
ncbi:MAG TPA: hypothetical protein VFX89_14770 [Gammaproteobacteria bacterium]|nr:hypothetical protein [Gammaproteobacteria bacterium]